MPPERQPAEVMEPALLKARAAGCLAALPLRLLASWPLA